MNACAKHHSTCNAPGARCSEAVLITIVDERRRARMMYAQLPSAEGSTGLMRRGRSCTSPRQGVDSPPVNGDSLYPATSSFYKAVRCTASLRTHRLYKTSFYLAERVHGVDAYSLPPQEFWRASAAAERYRSPADEIPSSTFYSSSSTTTKQSRVGRTQENS